VSSQLISSPLDCCTPLCDDLPSTQIPGPQGPAGAACVPCADGADAFTTLAGGFAMPAEGATVVTSVADNSWMGVNQILFVQFAGYMQVTAINVNGTGVTLKNLEDTATGAYTSNAAPATAIPNLATVSPGGLQGPAGVSPAAGAPVDATYITQTPNGTLTNEQPLNALAAVGDAYLKVTQATGVVGKQVPPIPIADGGTNGVTANAAFNNLSPVTTRGDLIVRNATVNARLGLGTVGKVLTSDGTDAVWSLPTPSVLAIASTAIDLTLTSAHYTVLVDATTGNRIITLPAAASNTGRVYNVKKIDATGFTVTIDPNAAELIDGAANKIIAAQWTNVAFQSNGTSWFIL